MENTEPMSHRFNRRPAHGLRRVVRAVLLALSLCGGTSTPAQTPPSQSPAQVPVVPPDAGEELVRINAELVQTGVSVTDARGKFVDGLRAEDFELRVDGSVQPITFFERVLAGSAAERATENTRRAVAPPATDTPGRTVLFYIDDLHLAPDSLLRTRKLIVNYVERELGAGDWAAVAAASGQTRLLATTDGQQGGAANCGRAAAPTPPRRARLGAPSDVCLSSLGR